MSITSVIVPDHLETLDDAALIALQSSLAASRRELDALSARVSAEVGRRSDPSLGYDGLAQRSGARTPEAFVQRLAGVTRTEARALIRVGTALETPWLSPVAQAVESGELSIAAADGIVAGLGEPGEAVSGEDLAEAAARLVAVAGQTTPERVAAAARSIRDDLDLDGVADREAALRDKRFLRLIPQPDGMTRLLGLLDPESAATVSAAVDAVTAPRRGGPRFVDEQQKARAEAIVADERSTEQIAVDALVDMVRLAVAADPGTLFGTTAPTVRVHVTLASLEAGRGAAQLEGQTAQVGLPTVRRLACAGGYVPVLLGTKGQPLDVGRSERLFTWRQRIAMAARDGGCIFPGCDRPPSWCEAHHIDFLGAGWRANRHRARGTALSTSPHAHAQQWVGDRARGRRLLVRAAAGHRRWAGRCAAACVAVRGAAGVRGAGVLGAWELAGAREPAGRGCWGRRRWRGCGC